MAKTRKYNVAHVTTVHPCDDTRIYRKYCRSSKDAGFETLLIAPFKFSGGSHRDLEVDVRFIPCRRRLLRMLLSPWSVIRHVISEGIPVVHFHDPEFVPAAIVLRMLGKKLIYDVHEDLVGQTLQKEYLPEVLRGLIAKCCNVLQKVGCRTADVVISANSHIDERLGGSTTVVFNYSMLSEFGGLMSGNGPLIRDSLVFYVGGISRARGAVEMLTGFKKFAEGTPWKFVVAGPVSDRDLLAELEQIAEGGQITLTGPMDRTKVLEYLGNASIGVVLYLPGPNHTDSCPNKLYEYMAAGVSVIASNFESWSGIVEDYRCGYCVDSTSVSAIESGFNLLANCDELKAMGERGQKAVESRFNWESQFKTVEKIYNRLLSE